MQDGKRTAKELNKEEKDTLFIRLLMTEEQEIYRFILALYPYPTEADDILQETATVLWQKFDEFELNSSFRAWAVKVAHYVVLQYWRKRSTSPIRFSTEILQILSDELGQEEKKVDERIDILKHCLAKLSDEDYQIIKKRYTGRMTIRELAGQLERSEASLYKMLSRAHYYLMECIMRTVRRKERYENA